MSGDVISPQDQAAIDEVAKNIMQQIAAGRTAESIAQEMQRGGWNASTSAAFVAHVQEQWRAIEAAPRVNAAVYLRMKYPEMRPARSVPWLFTVHGIGTMLCGEFDRDAATGTLIRLHCFCFFYIPILAVAAYRVTPSGRGWSLIGKVPLPRFAKWWNFVVVAAIGIAIGLGV